MLLDNLLMLVGIDAIVAAVVSLLIANFVPAKPLAIARALLAALDDGKLSETEVAGLRKQLLGE